MYRPIYRLYDFSGHQPCPALYSPVYIHHALPNTRTAASTDDWPKHFPVELPGQMDSAIQRLADSVRQDMQVNSADVDSSAEESDEKIVTLARQYELCSPEHSHREGLCLGLSHALYKRWTTSKDKSDLALSARIEIQRDLLDLRPPDSDHRAHYLHNLVVLLQIQHYRTADDTLIDTMIQLRREELMLRLALDERRAHCCSRLAYALGMRFGRTGDLAALEEAIQLNRQALTLHAVDDPRRLSPCTNLPELLKIRYEQTGDIALLQEALELYKDAQALCPLGHVDRVDLLNSRAHMLCKYFTQTRDLTLLDEGTQLAREALSVNSSDIRARVASYQVLARLLSERFALLRPASIDLIAECIRLSRQALALQPFGTPDHANCLANLGSLLLERAAHFKRPSLKQEVDEIRRLLDAALALYPQGVIGRWSCLHRRAVLAFLCREHGSAIKYTLLALESAPTFAMDLVKYSTELALGLNQKALSRTDQEALMKTCEQIVDRLQMSIDLASHRASQLHRILNGTRIGPAAYILSTRIDHVPLGLLLLERTRGLIWTQLLQLREPQLERVPPELAKTLEELMSTSNVSRSDAVLMREPQSISPSYLPPRDLLYERRTQLQQVLAEIRALPGLADFMRGPGIDALISTAIDHVVVVLVADQKECHALIIKSSTRQLIDLRLTIRADTLRDLTFQAAALQRRGFSPQAGNTPRGIAVSRKRPGHYGVLARIWQTIVCPVIECLKLEKAHGQARPRLHWCPTGAFVFVPVHAAGIYDGSAQVCVSDYVVSSYTPTLTSLSRAQQTSTTYTIKDMRLVTVVAEQAHNSTMPFLRYAAQEAKEVAATAAKAGLAVSSVAQTASKEDVIAALTSAHAVHFACHGIQDDAEPHKSHFCLGDGDLTISDLIGASMDHGFLAFLSACETAQGDQKHADEVVHLAATMLFAGFKSVVATMWAMNDKDGPYITKHFYDTLFQREIIDVNDVPYALDDAVTALRKSGVSPERWATFVHMGA